eukprot:2010554-Pyramimonas_sp.AAC.1
MQVKQLVFLNQFSGDPPLRGSPGVLAPHGKLIGWQFYPRVEAQNASEPIDSSKSVFWWPTPSRDT